MARFLTKIKPGVPRLRAPDLLTYRAVVVDAAKGLRERAVECHAIAKRLPGGLWRAELLTLATELEQAADALEAEARAPPPQRR